MDESESWGNSAAIGSRIEALMPLIHWRAIEQAALYAFEGNDGAAELARFAANYHNLSPMGEN